MSSRVPVLTYFRAGRSKHEDGVGVEQMGTEGLPLSWKKTEDLFFSQPWQWGGGGVAVKISWKFQFLCEMSYLEIFSLEQMKKTEKQPTP